MINQYQQFIWGKLKNDSQDFRIIAKTAAINKTEDQLKNIALTYRFWGATPPLSQNDEPNLAKNKAVGFVLEADQVILIQASLAAESTEILKDDSGRSFFVNCYVFIPIDSFKNINFSILTLLLWFYAHKIPALTALNMNLESLSIPFDDLSTNLETEEELASKILEIFQESPHVKDSLKLLLNNEKLVFKHNHNRPELINHIALLLELLPARMRLHYPLAIGLIDENNCNWARLLYKIDPSVPNIQNTNLVWVDSDHKQLKGTFDNSQLENSYFNNVLAPCLNNQQLPLLLKQLNKMNYDWLKDKNVTDLEVNLCLFPALTEQQKIHFKQKIQAFTNAQAKEWQNILYYLNFYDQECQDIIREKVSSIEPNPKNSNPLETIVKGTSTVIDTGKKAIEVTINSGKETRKFLNPFLVFGQKVLNDFSNNLKDINLSSFPSKLTEKSTQINLSNLITIIKNEIDKLNLKSATQKPIKLGIWGTPGSGKTTYLFMLFKWLKINNSGWEVIPVGEKAFNFIDQVSKHINQGDFPPPTEMLQELEIFSYQLANKSDTALSEIKITLDFVDAPGGVYEDISGNLGIKILKKDENNQIIETHNSIIDYLMSCDGIIFLLDPKYITDGTTKNENIFNSKLSPLFLKFQQKTQKKYNDKTKTKNTELFKIQQFMAFCGTKIDKPELWDFKDDPLSLIKNIISEVGFRELLSYIYCNLEQKNDFNKNRCEFFVLSSIGVVRDNNGGAQCVVEEVREEQFNYTTTKIKTLETEEVNVVKPVEWLIASILKYRTLNQNIVRGTNE